MRCSIPAIQSTQKPTTTDLKWRCGNFERILKPGGTCLISVPYGKWTNLGWYQVFDLPKIESIVAVFAPTSYHRGLFRLLEDRLVTRKSFRAFSTRLSMTSIAATGWADDLAASSRAVACLELTRMNIDYLIQRLIGRRPAGCMQGAVLGSTARIRNIYGARDRIKVGPHSHIFWRTADLSPWGPDRHRLLVLHRRGHSDLVGRLPS